MAGLRFVACYDLVVKDGLLSLQARNAVPVYKCVGPDENGRLTVSIKPPEGPTFKRTVHKNATVKLAFSPAAPEASRKAAENWLLSNQAELDELPTQDDIAAAFHSTEPSSVVLLSEVSDARAASAARGVKGATTSTPTGQPRQPDNAALPPPPQKETSYDDIQKEVRTCR